MWKDGAARNFRLATRQAGVVIPIFGLIWWAYWAISESATSLHPDMTEAYVWGQEFQLGYWKHPPFWAWVCGAWFLVFPRSGVTFALLSATNATIGLWGVWRLVGLFARGEKRVAATALFLLTPFPTFWAYKYNANSIFLSVWPWTLFFFVRAYERRRLVDSLGLGAMVAAALLCKYYALILCVTIGLAALSRPERNAYFRSPSPYVSAAVAALLILPYLSWLRVNHAPPLGYLGSVSGLGTITTLYNIQKVFFGTLVELSVPAAIVLYYGRDRLRDLPRRARARWADPTYRFLTILNFAPLGLTLAVGLAIQVKLDNYMLAGAWVLAPLWMIETIEPSASQSLARAATGLAAALSLGALAVSPLTPLYYTFTSDPGGDRRLSQSDLGYREPRQELAEAATQFWRSSTGLPLKYVAGSPRYSDGVAFYGPERASDFAQFDLYRSRWVTREKIARDGLLAVCVASDDDCLAETQRWSVAGARTTTMQVSRRIFGQTKSAESFVVTAIPPQSSATP